MRKSPCRPHRTAHSAVFEETLQQQKDYHPFAIEEPAPDGNFYEGFAEFTYSPPLVFSDPNRPPYSDLPAEKWPKTEEEEFKKFTQGMIRQRLLDQS